MHGSYSFRWVAVVLLGQAVRAGPAVGDQADNTLSPEEKAGGWILTFRRQEPGRLADQQCEAQQGTGRKWVHQPPR